MMCWYSDIRIAKDAYNCPVRGQRSERSKYVRMEMMAMTPSCTNRQPGFRLLPAFLQDAKVALTPQRIEEKAALRRFLNNDDGKG